MKRFIKGSDGILAAETSQNDEFNDTLDVIQDDFDYIVDGLGRLSRTGASGTNAAMIIVEQLQSQLDDIIQQIADTITEGE